MPHLMPMDFPGLGSGDWGLAHHVASPQSLAPSSLLRVQPLHRLAEVTGHRQRQHVDGIVDRPCDLDVVTGRGTAEYPRGDAGLVARMADAELGQASCRERVWRDG